MNISEVFISTADSTTGCAGKIFTLECSADVTPIPLPQNVPLPHFEWFFGPTNTSVPSGVTVSDVTNSGNTYTSTLQFSPLRESHTGTYTCQLGGNERLTATTYLDVNGKSAFPEYLAVNYCQTIYDNSFHHPCSNR